MRNRVSSPVSILVCCLLAPSLHALGTEVVTDPVSYTYYVQQIELATRQINLITQQVQTLGGIKTATDDVKRQIYTVQDAFQGAMNSLINAQLGLANAILDTPETVDKLFSMERDSITTNPDDGGVYYKDTAAFLDDFYKNTGTMEAATWLHINDERLRRSIKKDVAQLAFRRLLYDQDKFKQRQKDRIDRTTDIMKKMQNQSDPSMIQTQINTAMLIQELVQIQTEMLELQKAAIVAYAFTNYQGANFKKVQKKLEAHNDEDKSRKADYHEANKPKTTNVDALRRDVDLNKLYGF